MIVLLKLILYPTIVLLGGLALFAYRYAKSIFNKYRDVKEVQCDPNWQGFIRKDFNKWNEKEILFGCIWRFPIKVIVCFWYIAGLSCLIVFSLRFLDVGRKLQKHYISFMSMLLFWLVLEVDERDEQSEISTPVIISNHVCWMDIIYLATRLHPVSFVAKQEISQALLIGSIAKYLKCLFITRENQEARQEILGKIKQRVKEHQLSQDVNRLLIFPEGTTSNGKSILKFKKGAFADKPKITIFGLIYHCQGFDMGMDEIIPLEHMVISLALQPKLVVRTEEVQALSSQTPEEYMQRCQQKMHELTGFPIFETGFTEKCAFKQMRFGLKEQ